MQCHSNVKISLKFAQKGGKWNSNKSFRYIKKYNHTLLFLNLAAYA